MCTFFFLTLLLSSFWTSRGHRCRPFFPPVLAFNFLSRIGFSNPTASRFSSSVANSRSRAFRKSICAQEKVPTNLYEYALCGARTHETDLCCTRLQYNVVRHRGDRRMLFVVVVFSHYRLTLVKTVQPVVTHRKVLEP